MFVILPPNVAPVVLMEATVELVVTVGAEAAAATVRMRFPLVTARDPVVLAAKPDPATVRAPGVPDTPVALPDLTMSV
jgi:hypothetical protein